MHGHPAHLARSPCPLAGTGCFPRRHACTTPFCGIAPFYKKETATPRGLFPLSAPMDATKSAPAACSPLTLRRGARQNSSFTMPLRSPCILPRTFARTGNGALGARCPTACNPLPIGPLASDAPAQPRGAAYACAFQPQSPASIPVTRLPAESLARPLAANETPMSAIFGKADSHAYHRYGGPCRKGVHPCKTHAI